MGKSAVELYAAAHIFAAVGAAHSEAEALKRADALIAEEEASQKAAESQALERAAADKERKARKKERQRAKKEAEQPRMLPEQRPKR